jgi:voltage-gated potassium channel
MLAFADCTIATIGLLAIVISTSAPIAIEWPNLLRSLVYTAALMFAVEVYLRLKSLRGKLSPQTENLAQFAVKQLRSPPTLIDVVSVLLIPITLLVGIDEQDSFLFGLFWVLKFGKYSTGLILLGRVIRNAADSLLSVLLGFVIILIAAATGMYLLEGASQPEQFGSIPLAMWWGIVTLTTTGYGDIVPLTVIGRLLAGTVMVCGIAMFGLFAGILASGFADELRRREFLQTWDLVARVPFFQTLGADKIAAVAKLLKRREMSAGQVVMRRGHPGDAMYFLVSGEVEVELAAGPIGLSSGSFFGEVALITGEPRSVTVTTTAACVLLELDVADFRRLASESPEMLHAISEEAARRRGSLLESARG